MAKKISQLTDKPTLAGTEQLEINDAGTSKSATAQAIADLAAGGGAAGLRFTSDTGSTADSDPGAGLFKWNHATQASATILYFDDSTADAVSVATYWAGLTAAGYMLIVQGGDPTRWQSWKRSGVTDGTGYRKCAVVLQAISADAIQDGEECFCQFDAIADPAGASAAADVTYDNGASGLVATDVQAAIDEVVDMLGPGGGVLTRGQAIDAANVPTLL